MATLTKFERKNIEFHLKLWNEIESHLTNWKAKVIYKCDGSCKDMAGARQPTEAKAIELSRPPTYMVIDEGRWKGKAVSMPAKWLKIFHTIERHYQHNIVLLQAFKAFYCDGKKIDDVCFDYGFSRRDFYYKCETLIEKIDLLKSAHTWA